MNLFQLQKQKEINEGRTVSSREVAREAGVGYSTYVSLRRGALTPKAKTIEPSTKQKLATYFGVKVEDIDWSQIK